MNKVITCGCTHKLFCKKHYMLYVVHKDEIARDYASASLPLPTPIELVRDVNDLRAVHAELFTDTY
jgi:hypothetical protein